MMTNKGQVFMHARQTRRYIKLEEQRVLFFHLYFTSSINYSSVQSALDFSL